MPHSDRVRGDRSARGGGVTRRRARRKGDACYRIGRSTAGLGLFATVPIRRGAFIVEYSGPRIPTRDAKARERTTGARYMFEINSRWTVDGSLRSNIGRYANHSCAPNSEGAVSRGKVI